MAKIYHYTKLSTAIEFILPSMTLRTNFLNKMNGPKENQKWAFGGVDIDYEKIYPDSYSRDASIAHEYRLGEEFKSKVQAICFVHSDSDDCDGFQNEMMWAQYAENHSGICLELDSDIFIRENEHLNIFKFENINYGMDKDVSLYWDKDQTKEENINRLIKRHYKELFLSKSHYWEKEYEKRLLIIDDNYKKLDITNSLIGVYYGLLTNANYFLAIEQHLNLKTTNVYKVRFEDNRLKRMQKRNY